MDFAMGSDGKSLPVMELFDNMYNVDDLFNNASLQDVVRIPEFDLPDYDFDVEAHYNKVCAELATEKEDYTDLFAEVVEANQKVAIAEMQLYVTKDDILQGLDKQDVFKLSDKVAPIQSNTKSVTSALKERDSNSKPSEVENEVQQSAVECHVRLEKIKTEIPETAEEDTPSFVYVQDIVTKQHKVISLRKGEELPEGYRMASMHGDLPPNELAKLGRRSSVVLPRLQDLISRNTNLAKQPPPPPPVNKPVIEIDESTSSSSASRLNPLSELMAEEAHKKSRLKQKQQSGLEESKAVSTISNSNEANSQTSNSVAQNFVDLRRVANLTTKPTSEGTTTVSSALVIKPSASVVPLEQKASVTISERKQKGGPYLFNCKLCKEYFFPNYDHRFRRHMFIKHSIEIQHSKEFEDSKIFPETLRKCKKCGVIALKKLTDHRMRCNPLVSNEDAFVIVNKWSKESMYKCGVDGCSDAFETRYQLKRHVELRHSNVASKMLVDPDFRCGGCLKRFSDSYYLGYHVGTCTDSRPSSDTILELAKSLLFCDYCEKNHNTLQDASSCYLGKTVFKCVLCMAAYKEKKVFYKHLHDVHNLQLQEQALIIECPICNFGPEKYTVTFPHILMEHYTPALSLSNQPLAINPPTRNIRTSVVAKNPSGLIRAPELRPAVSPVLTSTVPTGCVFNTTRLTPTTGTTQIYTPRSNFVVKLSPSANIRSNFTGDPRQISAVVSPTSTASQLYASRDNKPGIRLPMAGMFKATRPQVGYVRPQRQPVPLASTAPIILRTTSSTFTSLPRVYGPARIVSSATPPSTMTVQVVSTSSMSQNIPAMTITPAIRNSPTVQLQPTRTVAIAPRPTATQIVSVNTARLVARSGSGPTNNLPGAGPVERVTATISAPTVTLTSTGVPGNNVSAADPSRVPIATTQGRSQSQRPATATASNPDDSDDSATVPKKPRIVTINGRTYEYMTCENQMIQNLQNRLSEPSNSGRKSATTSAILARKSSTGGTSSPHIRSQSGQTVVRYPPPNNSSNTGMPGIPSSGVPARPATPMGGQQPKPNPTETKFSKLT